MKRKKEINDLLKDLYTSDSKSMYAALEAMVEQATKNTVKRQLNHRDCMLITYGDSIVSEGQPPLQCLKGILDEKVGPDLSAVHLLPFYPYSSDDGFSVIDYRQVNPSIGTWSDVEALSTEYDLMFDAVINHISSQSEWVKAYRDGQKHFEHFFIECDPKADYSMVTRPRALPLLTAFDTKKGEVNLWTTFSKDQVDLNFQSPQVFLEIMAILLMYIEKGARYIRLDAIGFLWKEMGTSCMNLPQTHQVIQLMRLIIEEVRGDVIIITETNIPHLENISYFGNGHDEAHMVYQFPLPPLTLYTFMKQDVTVLLEWLKGIENVSADTTYFNFLASHDGIGVRPVEGILTSDEVDEMAEHVKRQGGRVSYRTLADGGKSPYELNINYLDALCEDGLSNEDKAKKFIASQAILLSVVGVPGIYVHSLFGSRNDLAGMEVSGINRRINRAKLQLDALRGDLETQGSLPYEVFKRYKNLLECRRGCSAFSPLSSQKVMLLDQRIFSLIRENEQTKESIEVYINISDEVVRIEGGGLNILTQVQLPEPYNLQAYEVVWIVR